MCFLFHLLLIYRWVILHWLFLVRRPENLKTPPGLNQDEGLVNVDDTLEREEEERAGDISERVIDVDTEEEVNVEQEEEVVRLGNWRDRDITIIDLTKSPAPPRIRSLENSRGRQSNTATHQEGGKSEDPTCPICLTLIWELKKDGENIFDKFYKLRWLF